MVPVVINNNCVNIVSDSDSESSDEDFKNSKDNFIDEDVNDQVKISPQTTVNTKVFWAMKKIQALYNDDANKSLNKLWMKKVPLTI